MNASIRYRELLKEYDKLIDSTDWSGKREALVEKMDLIWKRMSEKEQKEVQAYMNELYQIRLNREVNCGK